MRTTVRRAATNCCRTENEQAREEAQHQMGNRSGVFEWSNPSDCCYRTTQLGSCPLPWSQRSDAARYEIDEALGCVFSSASGHVLDKDLLDHQRRLRCDRRFKPDLKQLFDFRGLAGINVTLESVHEL